MKSKSPPLKRRKLIQMNLNDDDESKLAVEISKTKGKKKKFTNMDKLGEFGPVEIISGVNGDVSLLDIRQELFLLTHTNKGKSRMFGFIEQMLHRRALGCDLTYHNEINKNGKSVLKKDEEWSNVVWAVSKTGKGGGTAAFTPVENAVFTATASFIVAHATELHIDPELGPLDASHVSCFQRVYITIMHLLKYGFTYPKYVFIRDKRSLRKHLKWSGAKKNMAKVAVEMRSIYSDFGGKLTNIATDNRTALQQATPSSTTSVSTPANSNSLPPCLPRSKKPKSAEFYDTALSVVKDIKAKVDKAFVEQKAFDPFDISTIPTNVAAPPISSPMSMPPIPAISMSTNTNNMIKKESSPEIEICFDKDERIVFDYLSYSMDMNETDGVTPDLKENVVNLLIANYHKKERKHHVVSLVKYVKAQNMKDVHQLNLIKLDLNQLNQ